MSDSRTIAPLSHDRVPELDLLRFIAATFVVFYHYTYKPAIDGIASDTAYGFMQEISRYGYLGVQLFFLISGFVILFSAEGRTLKQFVISRFLRLYPMFWVAVAITLFVLVLAGKATQFASVPVILANLTLLPGYFKVPFVDGVYWTLAIELKFYLIVAFAILFGQMKRIELWMYVWLAGLIATTFIDSVPVLKSLTMLPHGLFFVGGAVAYFIRSRGLSFSRGAALLLCTGFSVYHSIQGLTDFTFAGALASAFGVAVLVVIFHVVLFVIAMKWVRLPSAKLLLSLGALTYPLYLLHNVIGKVVFAWVQPQYGIWVGLFVILAVAYGLSWFCAARIEPLVRGWVASLIDKATRTQPSKLAVTTKHG